MEFPKLSNIPMAASAFAAKYNINLSRVSRFMQTFDLHQPEFSKKKQIIDNQKSRDALILILNSKRALGQLSKKKFAQ